jgi:hypothetical protein
MKIFNEEKMWITRVLDASCRIKIKSPLLASIIIFGLPIDILLSIFLTIRKSYISPQFFLSYILCIIWLNLGPYFIWYYERKVITDFFQRLGELLPQQEVKKLSQKYRSVFAHKFWILIIPWMSFLFFAYHDGFVLDVAGTFGFHDVWTWLLSIPIVWIPIIAGMGSWGVITTILAVNDVVRRNLRLDPLNIDKRGGLSCIGNYAIGTTILISSGSLFLPMAYQFSLQLNSAKVDVYLLVSFFIAIILLSFIYPIFITYARVKEHRNKLLEKLRVKYNKAIREQELSRKSTRTRLESYFDSVRIRTEYNDLSNLNLYPFDISVINKLISSVLFPMLITFIQQLVT